MTAAKEGNGRTEGEEEGRRGEWEDDKGIFLEPGCGGNKQQIKK